MSSVSQDHSQEPSVGAADRHVEDQKEILIKRRIAPPSNPGVLDQSRVDESLFPLPSLPHSIRQPFFPLLKAHKQDMLQPGIHIRIQIIAAPLQAKRVIRFREIGSPDLATGGGAPEGVEHGSRTPVESRGVGVPTAERVGVSVAACFGDVDFSGFGPFAVFGFFGHHPGSVSCIHMTAATGNILPDGWPQPVSDRHLSNNFHASILNKLLPLRTQSRTSHRRQSISLAPITRHRAIMVIKIRVRTGTIQSEVQCRTIPDIVIGEGRSHVGECRNDVQALGVSEGVRRVGGRPVEGAGAESADLDFVGPDGRVDIVKVLIEDEAVLLVVSMMLMRGSGDHGEN